MKTRTIHDTSIGCNSKPSYFFRDALRKPKRINTITNPTNTSDRFWLRNPVTGPVGNLMTVSLLGKTSWSTK